jgi:hypothetical protein
VNKPSWRKEQTVGIPQREFMNHHKPLDLGKVQGRYDDVFPKGFKAQEGQSH